MRQLDNITYDVYQSAQEGKTIDQKQKSYFPTIHTNHPDYYNTFSEMATMIWSVSFGPGHHRLLPIKTQG